MFPEPARASLGCSIRCQRAHGAVRNNDLARSVQTTFTDYLTFLISHRQPSQPKQSCSPNDGPLLSPHTTPHSIPQPWTSQRSKYIFSFPPSALYNNPLTPLTANMHPHPLKPRLPTPPLPPKSPPQRPSLRHKNPLPPRPRNDPAFPQRSLSRQTRLGPKSHSPARHQSRHFCLLVQSYHAVAEDD